MGFGDDQEILQDFLVEAGEIIEQLSEQLVELEQRPDDHDLLNAIFRGFHTVKGGAGFLQLDDMVECCHITESLFDKLRNGEKKVTSELMDVVLQSLDTVTSQFEELKDGQPPSPADPALIKSLEQLLSGDAKVESQDSPDNSGQKKTTDSSGEPSDINISDSEFEDFLLAIDDETPSNKTPSNETPKKSKSSTDEFTEDEFDNLLDELHGSGKAPNTSKDTTDKSSKIKSNESTQDISDDEFENLLDQLHGSGKAPGPESTESGSDSAPDTKKAEIASKKEDKNTSSDNITDDEFDDLLDQLHGKTPSAAENNKIEAQVKDTPSAELKTLEPKAEPAPPAVKLPSAPVATKAKEKTPSKAQNKAQASPQAESTVRVDTQRLDDIMNMVGELVLVRNRLVRLGLESSEESMQKAVANLDVVTADLQSSVMKTRMQPIKKVFGRFPRVVRDLARNLNKEINLELRGEDTDLDKNLVEALADPLVHLVRNSVDHGIEIPSVRESNGKSRTGKIILSAEQEGDHILLSILDDGGGMDPDALRDKAIEKGVLDVDSAARMSDEEAFNLIFAPGFSTKQEISDVSGRGVGMDVVKTKITQLNGSISIYSAINEGTTISIRVPLTLAIMPTLMIMLGHQTFALPLVNVNEIFYMDLTKSNRVDGQECILIRDRAVPIFHLKQWLLIGGNSNGSPKEGHVVIVTVGTQRVGFVVDQLIGQEEVVIKPLGEMLHGTPGLSGATITGDGTIALILDVPSMLKKYANR